MKEGTGLTGGLRRSTFSSDGTATPSPPSPSPSAGGDPAGRCTFKEANRAEIRSRLVARLYWDHRGRSNAIGADDLSDRLGIPRRLLRLLIAEVNEEGEHPIGASSHYGVFYCWDREDVDEALRDKVGRIAALSRSVNGIRRAVSKRLGFEYEIHDLLGLTPREGDDE